MDQSAAYNAGQTTGTIIAFIAIYGGILALGYYFGNRLGRTRGDGTLVRWPIGVACVLVLLLMIGHCTAPSNAQEVSPARTGVPSGVVVEQHVYGPASAYMSDFSPTSLGLFNDGARKGFIEALRKQAADIPPSALSVSSNLMTVGHQKVIQTKVKVSNRLFLYQFTGVAGANTVLLSCSARDGREFDLSGTECERRVQLVFGKRV